VVPYVYMGLNRKGIIRRLQKNEKIIIIREEKSGE
jgi:hypothetical protein